MIYGDDNTLDALEKIAAEGAGLQKVKGYGATVRKHNRYIKSGGKRGNLMEVSPSTYTMKTSSVYADDNIHEALEKIALFGVGARQTTKKMTPAGRKALISRARVKGPAGAKARADAAKWNITIPERTSAFQFQGARTPGGNIPPGGLNYGAPIR